MKMRAFLFITTILIGSLMSSCNTDKDDDDNDRTYPELTATVTVSGAVSESYTFINVENDGVSSTHTMVSSFSSSTGLFSIAGSNINYTYHLGASIPDVQSGTYTLSDAQYGHLDNQQPLAFDELVSGSVSITSKELLWTIAGSPVYAISGSWVTEISDGLNPPSTITFAGSFSNMVVLPN